MALKTNNYVAKQTGVHLTNACAILGDLTLNRKTNDVRATFLIHADRESIGKYKPLDEVYVYFKWDRKTNIVEMAYQKAKTEIKEIETELGVIQQQGRLYGWDDDYVRE